MPNFAEKEYYTESYPIDQVDRAVRNFLVHEYDHTIYDIRGSETSSETKKTVKFREDWDRQMTITLTETANGVNIVIRDKKFGGLDYIAQCFTEYMPDVKPKRDRHPDQRIVQQLSSEELWVAHKIADRESIPDIASEKHTSKKTVESQRDAISGIVKSVLGIERNLRRNELSKLLSEHGFGNQ